MWLVLCPFQDISALWAYQGLQNYLDNVQLVSAELLSYSLYWKHCLGQQGSYTEIHLGDGRTLHSDRINGVLNRISCISTEHLQHAQAGDRDYAIQELTAFFISWLNALPCKVFNRSTAQGLAGAWRHQSEWVWLAMQAGLSTPVYRQSSQANQANQTNQTTGVYGQAGFSLVPASTVIVVGNQFCGALAPEPVLEGCWRLAQMAETPLLGVEFGPGWEFRTANPLPDLRLGQQAFLRHLSIELQKSGTSYDPSLRHPV
jgi:hypothetical protein